MLAWNMRLRVLTNGQITQSGYGKDAAPAKTAHSYGLGYGVGGGKQDRV